MPQPHFVVRMFCLCTLVAVWGAACGQDYPAKPIRMFATEAVGGTDFVARLLAQGLTESLGHQVIVDNRGNLAAPLAAKSPPDGYTLALLGPPMWISPLLQTVQYDPVKDFSPVIWAASSVNVLVVHPSLPVNSVRELIAFAKARPGQLNYASSMTGASNHLAAELFKYMAGVNFLRIPYKGASQALIDVVGGAMDLSFPSAPAAAPFIKSRKLRALGVTSAQPYAVLPDLPTIAATGVPGYESVAMFGVFVQAGTPAAIINRLNQELVRIVNRADVQERFRGAGMDANGSSAAQLTAAIATEVARAAKMIKSAGIRAD